MALLGVKRAGLGRLTELNRGGRRDSFTEAAWVDWAGISWLIGGGMRWEDWTGLEGLGWIGWYFGREGRELRLAGCT
jgi:hypothetical protein